MRVGLIAVPLVLAAACMVGDLDLAGLSCPCVTGYHCDEATSTCAAGPAPADGGARDGATPGTDGRAPDGAGTRHDSGSEGGSSSSDTGAHDTGGGRDTGAPPPILCDGGVQCGTQCVNPLTDPAHCGACNHDCMGSMCMSGACQPIVVATAVDQVTAVAIDSTNVYWSTTVLSNGTSSVFELPLVGGATTTLATGAAEILYLGANSSGIFALTTIFSVERFSPSGGGPTELWSGEGELTDLAVDTTHVYWGFAPVTGSASIFASTGAGSLATVASGSFTTLQITAGNSDVYWTSSTILQAPAAGGSISTIPGPTGGDGLAVFGTDLYVAAGRSPDNGNDQYEIYRVPVGGGATTTLATGTNGRCSAVAADSTGVYCADRDNGLRRVSLTGGSNVLLGGAAAVSVVLGPTFAYWADGYSVLKVVK